MNEVYRIESRHHASGRPEWSPADGLGIGPTEFETEQEALSAMEALRALGPITLPFNYRVRKTTLTPQA